MPRVRDNPQLLEAISMCSYGVSARSAWEQCGKPNGEAGIQNIRKAGKSLKVQREKQAEAEPEPEPWEPEATPGPGKGHPVAGFRLRPDQVAKQRAAKEEEDREYAEVYMQATAQ